MSEQKIDLLPLLRFMETLPKSGDVELTLLKCHLLVDEVLTNIICKSFKNQNYIKDARLTFAQKVKLARASIEIPHALWVWKALHLLNQARNELAHNLTKEQIEQKLETFTAYVKEHNTEMPEDALSEKFSRFHWAVFATYSVVSASANFDPSTSLLTS